jgi:hypothetical protein
MSPSGQRPEWDKIIIYVALQRKMQFPWTNVLCFNIHLYKKKIKHSNIKPSNLAQVIMILTSIQEMPGSNLDCGTDYTEWSFSRFYSDTQNKPRPLPPPWFKVHWCNYTGNTLTVFICNSCTNGAWSKIQSILRAVLYAFLQKTDFPDEFQGAFFTSIIATIIVTTTRNNPNNNNNKCKIMMLSWHLYT